MAIVKLVHYFLFFNKKKKHMVIMCSVLQRHLDGEHHTANLVPVVSSLHLPVCL